MGCLLSINYQLLNIRSCSYRLNDFRDGKVLAVVVDLCNQRAKDLKLLLLELKKMGVQQLPQIFPACKQSKEELRMTKKVIDESKSI